MLAATRTYLLEILFRSGREHTSSVPGDEDDGVHGRVEVGEEGLHFLRKIDARKANGVEKKTTKLHKAEVLSHCYRDTTDATCTGT